jgi:hypothetical protein
MAYQAAESWLCASRELWLVEHLSDLEAPHDRSSVEIVVAHPTIEYVPAAHVCAPARVIHKITHNARKSRMQKQEHAFIQSTHEDVIISCLLLIYNAC